MPNNPPSLLFRAPATFVTSSPDLAHLPESELPEVAFAGRSNCGKSSLINAMLGVKNLARTSNTPGRTKLLNFFNIGEKAMLVDLPGYGFAKASAEDRAQWQKNWQGYITRRFSLQYVFVLIDARRGIMKIDREIMTSLDKAAASYSIVLTKSDKLPSVLVQKVCEETRQILSEHPAAWREPLCCSAKKYRGVELLHQEFEIAIGLRRRDEDCAGQQDEVKGT